MGYRVISTIAFEAFACHDFGGEGSWLVVDVQIDCTSEYYQKWVTSVAWLAVGLYPIGAIALCTVLLRSARGAIVNPVRHRKDGIAAGPFRRDCVARSDGPECAAL